MSASPSGAGIGEFLDDLEARPPRSFRIVYRTRLPEHPVRHGVLSPSLPGVLDEYCAKHSISLFSHQAEAIQAARAGENFLLSTATASGKTLAYLFPVLGKSDYEEEEKAAVHGVLKRSEFEQ